MALRYVWAAARARLRSLLSALTGRARLRNEVREELRHHLEMRRDELVRHGLSRREAWRRARIELGHLPSVEESVRAAHGLRPFELVWFSWLDVKLGLRALVRHPCLTVVSTLTLAVGIPVGLGPLHFVEALLEAELPVEAGDRVRLVRKWDPQTAFPEPTRASDYLRWREHARSFEGLAAARVASVNVDGGDGVGPPVDGAALTASAFDVLRVDAVAGRRLLPEDEVDGAAAVVLVGQRLASRLFGDPAEAIGRGLRVGGERHEIVGVMARGFEFPHHQQLWLPLRLKSPQAPAPAGFRTEDPELLIFGRLEAGATSARAEAELAGLASNEPSGAAPRAAALRPEVVSFGHSVYAGPRGGWRALPGFWLVQALTLGLLGVACVNVALLVFARAVARSSELAVRSALGASRSRIVTQILAESLLLVLGATTVGLLVLDAAPRVLVAATGLRVPYWLDASVTLETVARALILGCVSALLAGAAPALWFTGRRVQSALQGQRAGGAALRFGRLSGALIVLDVAVSVAALGLVVLLASTVKEAWGSNRSIDLEVAEYLAAEIRMQDVGRLGAIEEILRRLETEPGVRGVGLASVLPRMHHPRAYVEVDGEPPEGATWRDDPQSGKVGHGVRVATVDVDFFSGIGHRVRAGRGFVAADLAGGPSPVVVSSSFVERVLGGRNAVGRRLRYTARPGQPEPSEWHQIVGVVGRLGTSTLDPNSDQAIYHPAAPASIRPAWLAVRVAGDPLELVPRLRAVVAGVDPQAVVASPQPLAEVQQGDSFLLLGIVAGVGAAIAVLMALAASGLYAILAFTVASRIRELGIRSALGASREHLVLAVAKRSLAQIGAGALVGAAAAVLLFGDALPSGSLTEFLARLAPGAAAVLAIALGSCALPTARALRVPPTEALRGDG